MTREEREKARIREEQEKAWIRLGDNLEKEARIVDESIKKKDVRQSIKAIGEGTEAMIYRIHKSLFHEKMDRVFMAPFYAYHRMSKPSPETPLMEHLEGVERELEFLEKEHPYFSTEPHVINMLNQTGTKMSNAYKAGIANKQTRDRIKAGDTSQEGGEKK